jgi:hypothetical protein
MVFQTCYLFGLEHQPYFYGFVFFGTLCSYNFHWFLTPKETPDDTASVKVKWSQKHRKEHIAIAALSLAASIFFLVHLWQHLVWLFVTALFTFLYTAPKLPVQPFIRLRKVAYGKTVFLSLAWMHITTMLPLLVSRITWQLPHYLFALNRFFIIYAICILFDLRDRKRDREEGIRSMITEFTPLQVDVIFWGIMVAFFITTAWLAAFFSWGVIAGLLIPGILLVVYYNWFKAQRSDYVYYFILDGLMVFSLPWLLLFQF